MIHRMKQKVLKYPNSDELLGVITQLTKSQDEFPGDRESREWTESIDRGGLLHVNHSTFIFFVEVEKELRKHYNHYVESEG